MVIDVEGVGHVVLKVSDLGRAPSFYSGVFCLTEVARQDFGDGTMACQRSVSGSVEHRYTNSPVTLAAERRR
jgi:catechol 2,3-dioxygenase-like lactoylglutathione lyase family enzyme